MSNGTVTPRRSRDDDGHRAKTFAIVFSLLGFFVLAGVIFGALAIWQAHKAEAAGVRARLWLWIGVLDIVFSAAVILSRHFPG